MTKWLNGDVVDMTAEEIAAMEEAAARYEAQERRRPLSAEEVTAMLIRQQINTLDVDDQTALRMSGYYPAWQDSVGRDVPEGLRFVYGGKLYKVRQAHTLAETWVPGAGTESLYTRIDEEHAGNKYDPIPYDGNMELLEGKYYTQSGVTYLCIRSTGQAVYHALAELVGSYVEEV